MKELIEQIAKALVDNPDRYLCGRSKENKRQFLS